MNPILLNQKVFPKQPVCKKTKWLPNEDQLLRQGIMIHGLGQWTKIALMVPGRSPKQCRERWTGQLDPRISRMEWTDQEDVFLTHLQATLGNSWARIASFMPGRAANAVKNRFRFITKNKPAMFLACLLQRAGFNNIVHNKVSACQEQNQPAFNIENCENEEWI